MRRGLFIVFEGIEGSGKSTQAELLASGLSERGIPFVLAREPGTTRLGEEVRALLLEGGEAPARAELLLMLAARAALVEQVVRPGLEAGRVVLSDRYELSTLAYQGYGRELELDEVRRLNAFATAGMRPDLTLLLELPPEEGEARRAAAGGAADRIERAGRAFHARVAKAYGLLAKEYSSVTAIDGTGSPDEVQRRILRVLEHRFPETFAVAPG